MGTEIFAGLPPDQADTLQQGYEDDGATVERVLGEDGSITLKVTYPDAAGSPASSTPSGATTEGTSVAATTAKTIVAACEAEWPAFSDDCSGFVRHVAGRLGITLTGLANAIVNEIRQGDWHPLQDGRAAKAAADAGQLVIGGLRGDEQGNPEEHGHVVVVVSGPLAHNAYPSAYWGRLGGVGAKDQTVNFAWRAGDRDRVHYAAKPIQSP
jgi:hypothetical protein